MREGQPYVDATEQELRVYVGEEVKERFSRETYTDLMNIAQGADLIINGEGVLAARLVAEKLGIPWVLTVLQPLAFLSAYDPSVLPALPAIFRLL